MRNFTLALRSRISTRLATEPLIIIGIDWISGTRYYSDKDRVVGIYNCEGKILDIGSFSSKLDAKATGQLDSFSVTLSDIDGTLKQIFDSEITLFRPVNIYLHYEGLAESDLGLIFKGKIVSPIEWSEGDRSVRLNIFSSVKSEDLLLEIKETSSDFPDANDIGKVLPLCFGTVLRVPATKLGNKRTGKLLTEITSWTTWYREFDDPTTAKLTYKGTKFKVSGFEDYPLNEYLKLEIDGTLFYGCFTSPQTFDATLDGFNTTYSTTDFRSRPEHDTDYANTSCAYISNFNIDLKGKYLRIRYLNNYRYYTVVENGVSYDQLVLSEEITQIPEDVTVKTRYRNEEFVARVTDQDYENGKIYFSRPFVDYFGRAKLIGTSDVSGAYIMNAKGKAEYEWSQLPQLSEPLSWIIAPGATVRLYGYEGCYIPNSVPSLEIYEVCARREGSIVKMPTSYYTKYLSKSVNINGEIENVTIIKLTRPLKQRSENWDDDNIYVSLKSSIGPNTASDVITWILNNRTNLTPDASSFTNVANYLTNYPSHFALFNQIDAIEAIKDISWQARCGVYIEANTMFIKYLSRQPTTSVFTLTTSNIELKSISVTKTESDDICTVFKGYWNRSYDEEEKRKIIKTNNEQHYPNNLFEGDFKIYNIESLVDKSLDFYKNRYSNDWIYLRAKTLMYGASIQIYDDVLVSIPYINNGNTIIGTVMEFDFDKTNYDTTLGIWLPLTNGDGTPYLNDSSDTMPDDPASGLQESEFSIPITPTVIRIGPALKTSNNKIPSSGDYIPTLQVEKNPDEYRIAKFKLVKEYEDYFLANVCQEYIGTEAVRHLTMLHSIPIQKSNPPLIWKNEEIENEKFEYENANMRKHSYKDQFDNTVYVREVILRPYVVGETYEAEYVPEGLIHVKDRGLLVWRELGNEFVFKEEVDPF